ncbi:MAG: tyrosine-type recombinase/integrase [Desulfovibrio sp.]|nr:tyrosine-type recombinase/integrase [Desulfovibrio sp.]
MMLNDTLIRSLKPTGKPKKHFDGGGMFLFVTATGSKLWRMVYHFDKKEKLLSFGEYPSVSLKDARERREEAKRLLAQGIDPGAHKKAVIANRIAEQANSFKNIALEWHENQTEQFTARHREQVLFRLNAYLFPAFGSIAVSKLEPQDLLAVARAAEKRGLQVTPQLLVQLVGQILRYAIATGRAKHNIAADLRGALKPRRGQHRAVITEPGKIGPLMRAIDSYPGYFPLCCALRLAPLVFTRPTELCAAEWNEIDLEAKEWRIPAARMKMRRLHIVPLADQAVRILEELHPYSGGGKYLFPSVRTDDKHISTSAVLLALRRMGYDKNELCTHGFRGMASTLLNELGYNRDWIERQLAHDEKNAVRAAYNHAQYLPERRKMMQAWADFLYELRNNDEKIPESEAA